MAISSRLFTLLSGLRQNSLRDDQIPLLYVEPGVTRGYREEGQSILYYIKSMFLINNETVNIWTHIIACIWMICKTKESLDGLEAGSVYTSVVLCFGICCTLYTFLSAFAHTVHSRSPTYHYVCFQLDYMGIGYYALGSCLMVYYCSSHVDFQVIPDEVFLPSVVAMSLIGLTCCTVSKLYYRRPYPPQRKLWNIFSYGTQVVLVYIVLLARYYDNILLDGTILNMNHHTLYILCLFISLVFFSSHIPEKFYPGTFDYLGQGHHIFHVLSSLASIQQFNATLLDIKKNQVPPRIPVPLYLYASLIAYTMLGALAISNVFYRCTKRRVQSDIEHEKKSCPYKMKQS